jgi:hypothetical protein
MASEDPDEAPERLSSDESLWGDQESRRKRGEPSFGVRVDELPQEEPGGTLARPSRPRKPSKLPARADSAPDPPALVPSEHPAPMPAESRSRRRLLRVDLLIAVAAVALLLVGFLLGAAVTRAGMGERQPPAQTAAPAPSTSILVQPAPPPRECLIAMEKADAAISYLVGFIRDQRLSTTIQEFIDSRRACQAAVR